MGVCRGQRNDGWHGLMTGGMMGDDSNKMELSLCVPFFRFVIFARLFKRLLFFGFRKREKMFGLSISET